LYDAYIKAFRWSTDRLDPKNGGVIGFVTNGKWLDANSTDGFRKRIEQEFSSIYVFDLRGDQRGDWRKEGGKIFGEGSQNRIAVTFLVKKPNSTGKATIYYHNIGDYLSREEKLKIISDFKSMSHKGMEWKQLTPNEHGDWLAQRSDVFETFESLAPEKKFDVKTDSVFVTYAVGASSNRDAWVYNFSTKQIEKNMKRTIDFYNQQQTAFYQAKQKDGKLKVENFIDSDPTQISWTRSLRKDADKNILHKYQADEITNGLYRPFFKQRLYFHKPFIESPGLSPRLFPNENLDNVLITITGSGASKDFSAIATNSITNLDAVEKAQCFPLYYYEEREKNSPSLFDATGESEYIRRDGVSDFILERAKKVYGKNVGKEDIFYYVYGILHSPDYRTAFANDLKKMLPRIPLVKDVRDFWKISKAGRKLAELHINYEEITPPEGVEVSYNNKDIQAAIDFIGSKLEAYDFKVHKMRFSKKGQQDTIIYNSKIVVSNIPEQAYDYVVNGKSAIEWIMERYQVKTDKKSGIKNDPNDWAEEVGNPRYILDLLLSIINVSVQTVEIVEGLPKMEFETE
jgi:predicted helicase